jgi:hypothetical protein
VFEVGLFDLSGVIDDSGAEGEVLVGSGIWDGAQLEVTAITSVDLAQFGGPILPGASQGHNMMLKIWDASKSEEHIVEYSIAIGPGTFDGLFSVIEHIDYDGNNGLDISNGCDLPNNNLYLLDGDVLYNSTDVIAGFQFEVNGAIVASASGGDAAAAGFTVSSGGSTVLGFSFSGATTPVGCGTLTSLELNGNATGLDEIIMAGIDGGAIIISSKPVAFPFNSSDVSVPHPTGVVAPEKEKPRTVDPPELTVKPAAAASPPEADATIAPFTSN